MRNLQRPALGDIGPHMKRHENAWVCAYTTELPISLEQLQQRLPPLIQHLQECIEAADGIVGHIKAYVSEQGKAVVFSAAGGDVNQTNCSDIAVTVDFTAIAILQNGELLRESVEKLFETLRM